MVVIATRHKIATKAEVINIFVFIFNVIFYVWLNPALQKPCKEIGHYNNLKFYICKDLRIWTASLTR